MTESLPFHWDSQTVSVSAFQGQVYLTSEVNIEKKEPRDRERQSFNNESLDFKTPPSYRQ